ncbi:T9SS type B sorting domain-containing protein [Flavobacterium dankookense]|uniref:Gliding motility-associated-like protein n=1 Tax=Flavobacterium dankookense TaxID=706186 RepID=A0A4R6Q5S2_9FLAO|nr:T9SS type B sorting domain-containing protein [Flavobacterium dankookense]TDP57427.1 gliding motility-associated-like protein [Flavobacterium dankookense]
MKKNALLLFTFILFITNCFSQFSKTHYIPPLSGASSVSPGEQFLYISTPNTIPVNFKIIELGGSIITGTVSKTQPYIYNIGFGSNTQLHVDANISSSIFNNKGYIIEAEDLVYVSARVIDTSGNQAGQLVSKGKASLGLRFRIGAFTNTNVQNYVDIHTTFISVLASENNTVVNFSNFKQGVTLVNGTTGDSPFSVTLNSGESYVLAVQGPNDANRDGLIGALVTADKPIAVNCGSFGGSNAVGNLDLGFDQIVPAERIVTNALGTNEYIFIKSTGVDSVEKVVLVADEDGTEISLQGNSAPSFIINAGDYITLNGDSFDSGGNLYVFSNKILFAYQSVGDGGAVDQRNQELFFVPPLSCQTPRVIDNIPQIDFIGSRQFNGRVTIVTQTNAILNFTIDGDNYTVANLPYPISGPNPVEGNPNYETYIITGLSGNVSVFSSGEIYLAAYGSEQAATFGGFYSGFTFEPEISFNKLDLAQASCIPNTRLSVNTLSPFDVFEWYFNGSLIPGTNNDSFYVPTQPGYYKVSATISSCTLPKESAEIPVSTCSTDSDNDGVIDNVDSDNDNDGLTNCTESYGNKNIDLTNPNSGSIAAGNYSNSFTGSVTFAGTGTPSATPIVGDADGNFATEAVTGKENSVSYTQNYLLPMSVSLEYATDITPGNLFSSATEINVVCPVNKTLTILNPDDLLLIDTNYDGIFESGITEYSSFDIRFRLNGNTDLAIGTGNFSIKGNLISSIKITNKNIVDSNPSKVALKLIATCIPIDTDNDGIPDSNDFDSDNDGIPDVIESQGADFVALTNVDANNDGIDDIFGTGISPADSDDDTVFDYLDLDSDNDGIYDIDESGSSAIDNNNDGRIDGINFGTNGLSNSLETTANSGVLNYTITDTNSDGLYNAIDLDSDDDLCNDVIEAGYLDSNQDGILGSIAPPTVDINGVVTSGTGYINPNGNYTIAAPISITTQPQDFTTCELQTAKFTIVSPTVDSYQWQLSTDNGTTWSNLTNNATYSGVTTIELTVSNVSPTMAGNQYRVFLNRIGNSCGLFSTGAILTTYALPVVTSPITLRQCDDDIDGISTFNLTQKNDFISANYLNEIFTYYTNSLAAENEDANFEITNPITHTAATSNVFARVENANGCYRVAQISLIVAVSQIPPNFVIPNQYLCDDFLDAANDDRDGISGPFNFSSIQSSLAAILPANVTIKFYKNEADFLAETDIDGNSLEITNITNYRNIGYPNTQKIWIRVDSTIDNSCFGFKTFDVVVESLPFANNVNPLNIIRHCDDDQDGIYGFDTTGIESSILNGQTGVNMRYTRANGTQTNTLPNPLFINTSEIITVRVSNNTTQTTTGACFDEVQIQFIVDDLPEAFAVNSNLTTTCDDEENPLDQDGIFDFDTTGFLNTIIGSQTGMNVYYFDENNILIPNLIPNELPNPFRTGTQNVRVVVENPINKDCTDEVILPFIVNPTPKIDLQEQVLICLPETQTTLDAGILDGTPTSDYNFQWFLEGNPLTGENNPTLTISSEGNYSVEVTNIFNCSKTRKIGVVGSEIASLQEIIIKDLSSEPNTVLINVIGSGNYEYALDDIAGPYRDSNFFSNVPMGLHDVYVRDINGCGILGPLSIAVLGIPQYFTPNSDGYNDTWNVKGVSQDFNYRSTIYIFDRYGKLLKQIGTKGSGWDGTYNGQPMPADDYWYSIFFEDGRSAKGHFSLKR